MASASRYPLRVAEYTIRPVGWPPATTMTVAALADPHFGGSYVDQPRLDLGHRGADRGWDCVLNALRFCGEQDNVAG